VKFALLIYQGSTPLSGTDRWKALSEAQQKAIYAEYAELNKTPGMEPGGEFSVYEAESMEAAIALAARIPAARLGGAVEIRPVETYW